MLEHLQMWQNGRVSSLEAHSHTDNEFNISMCPMSTHSPNTNTFLANLENQDTTPNTLSRTKHNTEQIQINRTKHRTHYPNVNKRLSTSNKQNSKHFHKIEQIADHTVPKHTNQEQTHPTDAPRATARQAARRGAWGDGPPAEGPVYICMYITLHVAV